MARFLVQRLFHGLTILLGVSMLVFICVELAPGDAIDAMLPPESFSSEAARAQMRHKLGLDQPPPIVYVRWLGKVVRGNLGYSLTSQKPITSVIGARMPAMPCHANTVSESSRKSPLVFRP